MTQSSVASPSTLEYASQSPRSHSNPSSPHHASARSVSTGMHHFEHIPGAYSSVIVVDPSMMPPGYMIGQVTTPRVEEPEEPLYVNAKQYHRILKRRAARANLEAQNRLMQRGRKFMHESRHLHAMRRPRGPGGRFLTAAEIAALDERESGGESSSSSSNHASNNNNNNNSGDSHNNNSNGSHQGYTNGGNHGNGSGNNTNGAKYATGATGFDTSVQSSSEG
ncbi:Transcriptional activator [Dissophora globulifera]|uniref:Transcriptional activator HAP2 n=1 Tax=Dissophora globulifera TaxID=979702 RepID=A0A9P6UPZ1_9FUNG|nr:Transcriptional activator [Dissophora globulifera]